MAALRTILFSSLLLGVGCRSDKDDTGPAVVETDADGDGYAEGDDCDDNDAAAFPGADELCDGIDNDCDGSVDNDAADAATWYADADGDLYGDDGAATVSCDQPDGYEPRGGDCDDTDAAFHPGASETDCADPSDYNCDGSVGYADSDEDGWAACEECDDASADINPDADEVCDEVDNNCDGVTDDDAVDATVWYADADGDTYGTPLYTQTACEQPEGYLDNNEDCDDTDAEITPRTAWYLDADSDGYGTSDSGVIQCEGPSQHVLVDGDCDDADSSISPDAEEVCDGADNDCDGAADDDDSSVSGQSTWYADADSDGYGDPDRATDACTQPAGYLDNAEDCDDTDAGLSPETVWHLDYDGDGYGTDGFTLTQCAEPSGFVSDSTDCDDADDTTNPGAAEGCDGTDHDCDGSIDNDADGDGYSDQSCGGQDCDDSSTAYAPSAAEGCDGEDYNCDGDVDSDDDGDGYADESCGGEDCDDGDISIYPGATEACDGSDHDCDGLIDNDDDGDGYADESCGGDDCDDSSADYAPDAAEGCDGEDHNCDGEVDNDDDGDGFAAEECGGDDCDDDDSGVYPDSSGACAAGESCDDLYDKGIASTDGSYTIDPDGPGGEAPIDVYCEFDSDGGWTLCAALTKGYVPSDTLYNFDLYAFQARLNGDSDYVYDTDAPARYTDTWNNSEDLNYGQFCRLMDETAVSYTRIQAKMYDYHNSYGSYAKNAAYDDEYEGVYSGNLFTQWFTNSSSSRSFTRVSGDQLYVQSNNNGYGGPYTTPSVGWSSSGASYTQSTNPWNNVTVSSSYCSGCANNGAGYNTLPYGSTTILNNLSHSFWSGIANPNYGWSDCTANGSCTYHESGFGVWLFWVN